jgi:hypothetical protein
MKFKCIKDFWMCRESKENGDIPAFKEGDVYSFYNGKEESTRPELYCPSDNQRSGHYMTFDLIEEYFVKVEE